MAQVWGPPVRPEASYLYIDGGCLQAIQRSAADRYFANNLPPINWDRLRAGHDKAFFYDAVPARQTDEGAGEYEARIAEKLAYLQHIARQPCFHVRTGDAKRRHKRGMEQKRVDVQLAVDAISSAARGGPPKVTLLTGDLDFAPLIEALVNLGVLVTLLYPLGETSDDLIEAADVASPVAINTLWGWIDERFQRQRLIPTASYCRPAAQQVYPALFAWDDLLLGRCELRRDGNDWTIWSGTPDLNGNVLNIHGEQPALFRPYAQDVFGLVIPAEAPI